MVILKDIKELIQKIKYFNKISSNELPNIHNFDPIDELKQVPPYR
jgi:hypothetical protein